jgi:hypothetical protein
MSAKNPKGKAGAGCGLSSGELQRGFDGEAGAQDVATHVASCDPCGSALEVLQTQRDAVQFLTGTSVIRPAHTAVEHILANSARAGREKLADLLYEMAKACLIVLPDLKRRIERKVEPREVPVVANELRSINSRLEKVDGAVALRDVPQQTPEEARALKVARSCLTILDNVEGDSERQQLAWSQVLIFEGNPAEAERVLRGLLASDRLLSHRELAQRNAMYAFMQQRKYGDALALGLEALAERADDCVVLYNMAVCHASLRNRSQFDAVSHRLAQHVAHGSPEWLVQLLKYEVDNFAKSLNTSPSDVAASFSLQSDGSQRGA